MRSRIVRLQSAFSNYPWEAVERRPTYASILQNFPIFPFVEIYLKSYFLEWSRKLRDDTKNGWMCSRLHFVPLKYFFGSFEKRHALRAFRRVWRARVNKNLAGLGDRLQFKERD